MSARDSRRVWAALSYPVSGDATERPLLVAWVLVLLADVVPVLPLLPLYGYLLEVLVASERGTPPHPFLPDIPRLIVRGAEAAVVAVAYLAVPLVVLLVTVYGATTAVSGGLTGTPSVLTFYAGSTAVLCIAFVGAYLCPIGLLRLGTEGSVRAAFDPATLRRVGGHAGYFAGWTAGSILLGVAGALGVGISSIPRVGPVVAALVIAYGAMVAFHVWGRGAARAAG